MEDSTKPEIRSPDAPPDDLVEQVERLAVRSGSGVPVDELLSRYPEWTDWIRDRLSLLRPVGEGAEAASGTLAKGVRVDNRFLLENLLGRGGFGEVWYAVDVMWHRGGRPYALKFIKPQRAGPRDRIEQMYEEADVLLSLAHENIVMLRTYGKHGSFPYLALDYVAGGSLETVLKKRLATGRGGLDADEARWLLQHISQAVDFAHKRDVVHRDIKPANILLDAVVDDRLDQSRVTAKLSDFGMALAPEIAGVEKPGGTLAFMAPELFTTRGPLTKDVLRPADIYALGATVYCAITGRPPFRGEGQQLIQAVIAGRYAPLASGDAELDDAVHRALSPVPAERWPSAMAFARAVGARRSDTSVVSPRTYPRVRAIDPTPILLVRRAPVFAVDCNAVLQIGIANPGSSPVENRVFLESIDPIALVVTTPDRAASLRAGASDWLRASIRPVGAGRHKLRLRVVQQVVGSRAIQSWETTLLISAAAGAAEGDGVVVPPTAEVREASSSEDAIVQALAEIGSCTVRDMRRVPLTRPFPAHGIAEPRVDQIVDRPLRVDLRAGGELQQRIYVTFRNRVWFGRVPETGEGANDLVWLRQPCRGPEQDPDNWRDSCHLSRRAGALLADDQGSFLQSQSSTLVLDGRPVPAGSAARLRSGRQHRLDAGRLEFVVRARRAQGRWRDLCSLLVDEPLQSTLVSTVVRTATRHHCIHVRRVGNMEEVEYAMASPWVGIGGDPSDDVVVAGLPPDALVLAHRNGAVFALVGAETRSSRPWSPRAGVWQPVVDGDSIDYGRVQLSCHATSVAELAADLGRGGGA